MMKTLIAASLSLACLAPAALASDANDLVETVRFDPADLHNPNAVAEIRAQLREAADRMCEQTALRGLDRARAERNCSNAIFEAADLRLEQRLADARTQSPRMAMTLVRTQ